MTMHKWAKYCLLPLVVAKEVVVCLVALLLSLPLRIAPEFVLSAIRRKTCEIENETIFLFLVIMTNEFPVLKVLKDFVSR